MKVDLNHLDLEGLVLDLGGPTGDSPQVRPELQQLVHVAHAKGVRGSARQSRAGLVLEDVEIEALLLHMLRLRLGSVLLEFHEAALTEANIQLSTGESGLKLRLSARSLISPRMRIELTETVILGRGHFEGVSLRSETGCGHIEADVARVQGLALDLGGLAIKVHEIHCQPLSLQWGEAFRLAAHEPRLDAAAIAAGSTEIEATGVRATRFGLSAGDIELQALQLKALKLNHAFATAAQPVHDELRADSETRAPASHSNAAPSSQAASSQASSSQAASADDEEEETVTPARSDVARILDGVSGHLRADVAVEVNLPVLMSRDAVHKLRLDVHRGTIDFRRLEQGLSMLEDALLDFSVRSDSLVLEVGLPLLPTRGFGKPIVRWPLAEHELELARQNRIHLSTLLSPMGVRKRREPGDQAGDSRLRHLEVRSLDCELSLAHSEASSVVPRATLDQLRLTGKLIHRPEGHTPETTITGSAQRMSLDLQGWELVERKLEVDACSITSIPSLEFTFSNAKPTRVALELAELAMNRLSWMRDPRQ